MMLKIYKDMFINIYQSGWRQVLAVLWTCELLATF